MDAVLPARRISPSTSPLLARVGGLNGGAKAGELLDLETFGFSGGALGIANYCVLLRKN